MSTSPPPPRRSLDSSSVAPVVAASSYVTSSAAGPSTSRSSGSLRSRGSSSLSELSNKGKGKGKEGDESGSTRVKVELTFGEDVATSDSTGRGRVQMVGGFATQSTYALPVEVLLSVLPAPSPASGSSFWTATSHKRARNEGCFVKAVVLTYEARTEFYDYTSYSSLRVHHQTHRVVLPTPLFIPFGDHSHASPTYTIPLDVLRIPGWLPPTFYLPYATLMSSVSATVELVNVSPVSTSISGSGWSRLMRTGSTISKTRVSRSAEVEVVVERLRVPRVLAAPMLSSSLRDRAMLAESGFQMRHYNLKTEAENPIDCVISVAEFLPFDTTSFDFNVRVRMSPGWEQSGGGKLSLVSMEYAVEQVEKYTSTPSKTFSRTYPIPEEQPLTGVPLRQRSTLHTLADLGVFAAAPHRSSRVVPLFQAEGGGPRSLSFIGDEGDLAGGQWKKLELKAEKPSMVVGRSGAIKPGERTLIAAVTTPFLRVGHGLKIKILCRDSNATTDTVILLNSPLHFVATPATGARPSLSAASASATPPPPPSHQLPPNSLPPYVTLFFESQTAREDPEPLPLYASDDGAPPQASPLASTHPMADEDSVDPVLALLEERAILERVHGAGRRPARVQEPDSEDQVEELLDLVEPGRSSRQSDRSEARADSPAPSEQSVLLHSPSGSRRHSRHRRPSLFGSISFTPHGRPPPSSPPSRPPPAVPSITLSGMPRSTSSSSSACSVADALQTSSAEESGLKPAGVARGRTSSRSVSPFSSRSSFEGGTTHSRDSSMDRTGVEEIAGTKPVNGSDGSDGERTVTAS